MYARLLTLTKLYQLAAQQAVLPRRTVIKLTQSEWDELGEDEQFARLYAGQSQVEMNGVVISVIVPARAKESATSGIAELSSTPHG